MSSQKSNLDRFLVSTTPCITAQFLPEIEMGKLDKQWFPGETEKVKFFTLADLWDCYDKCSAFGVEVPVTVDGKRLLQYYVPYLSATQIFTCSPSAHNLRDELDSETRDSCSFESSSASDESQTSKWEGLSDESGLEQDAHSQLNHRLGYLYFEYLEKSGPNDRAPFMDKINDLSCRYPGLMSLKSVDLSPASWMAVSWYPIYHIPSAKQAKALSTCFLTYHTLSSTFLDADLESDKFSEGHDDQNALLKPFGMVTYKLQGNVWASGESRMTLASLFSIADSWLKQLNVSHHDFNYFTRFNDRRG